MSTVVDKIILFTLTACPTGRSMGQVLTEIKKIYPELGTKTYYVEIHVKETNLFRIKQNPTILFLSKAGEELHRLEGFHETQEIQKQLDLLHQGQLVDQTQFSENVEVIEKYTVHLFKQNNMVPVEVEYRNQTAVKAPRITAIKLQLETRVEGLENPFSPDSTLELVQFEGEGGFIYLNGGSKVTSSELDKMKQMLLKTLGPYGIKEIEVYINRWEM